MSTAFILNEPGAVLICGMASPLCANTFRNSSPDRQSFLPAVLQVRPCVPISKIKRHEFAGLGLSAQFQASLLAYNVAHACGKNRCNRSVREQRCGMWMDRGQGSLQTVKLEVMSISFLRSGALSVEVGAQSQKDSPEDAMLDVVKMWVYLPAFKKTASVEEVIEAALNIARQHLS